MLLVFLPRGNIWFGPGKDNNDLSLYFVFIEIAMLRTRKQKIPNVKANQNRRHLGRTSKSKILIKIRQKGCVIIERAANRFQKHLGHY